MRQQIVKFSLSWLITAMVMMGISYLWHGVILNDFKNLTIAFPLFAALSVLVYLMISLGLNLALHYYKPEDNVFLKRITIGALFGFCIYLLVFVLGLSYSSRGVEHIVIDFTWQMIEQATGAFIVDFFIRMAHARAELMEE